MQRADGNLPNHAGSFIGREQEISEVRQALDDARLVTLTGVGGAGKTRLALQVAYSVQSQFSDGVWLVELAALTDGALTPQALAAPLGIREQPGRRLEETLAEELYPKQLLIVLDNCEHVISGASALVDRLLKQCPTLKILATSQRLLQVAGEVHKPVPPLTLPDAAPWPSVAELERYDAIRLFVTRVATSVPGFVLTDENAPWVAQICRQLDGIPLALELAAARARLLSLEQLDRRLENALRLLKTDAATTIPRHRSLQATLDWSYHLLEEPEQALLRRVSVFAGGFTLEMAETVCAGPGLAADDVLDVLGELVDKSLVVVQSRSGEAARYRLLETIRQYGQEKLYQSPVVGEAADVEQRHSQFCLALAQSAEAAVGSGLEEISFGRLQTEHDNLRAVLKRSQANPQRDSTGLSLAGMLWPFWRRRGYFSEGRDYLESLLQNTPDEISVERAKAAHGAGVLAFTQGDYTAAQEYYETSLTIRQTLGDQKHIAILLNNLANIAWKRGDYDTAWDLHQSSLAIRRELGDAGLLSASLHNLGVLANDRGDLTLSRQLLEESLALRRKMGDKRNIASSLNSLGEVSRAEENFQAAAERYEEALTVARQSGDLEMIAWPLHNLGHVALHAKELRRAADLFEESTRLFDNLGHKEGMAACLAALAGVACLTQQPDRAAVLLGASDALLATIGAVMEPADRRQREQVGVVLQDRLGEDQFAILRARGRGLSTKQAIAEALEVTRSVEPPSPPPPQPEPVAPAQVFVQPTAELRIHVLGAPQVFRHAQLISASDGFFLKARELLFYLVSHPPRSKTQLALALWPDLTEEQLRNSLHNTLHQLRGALGRKGWVQYEKSRYSFVRSLPLDGDPVTCWVDADEFEDRAQEGQRLAQQPGVAIPLLRRALELYRGDFLEGEAFDWASEREQYLRRLFRETALLLGQLWYQTEQYREAEAVYRQLLASDYYEEEAHRGVMRCLARQGLRPQALTHYQTFAKAMQDENMPLMPETTHLYERLRRAEE